MKNVITFIISSVILTLLVYLYFYATVGDDAMQSMEPYKDWIAVSVILLSVAIAFVAAKIRRRREDELDFGDKPASRVTQSRVSQSTCQDNDHDYDSDTDYDHDVEESRVTQSRVARSEEDVDGYYNHTAFVRYEVGDDEPYEDFVHVGVEDDEFDELSEAENNGRYLDMDFITENFSELHDRIIDTIRQQVMEKYCDYFYSEANNYLNPREYPLDSSVDYDVLNLE